MSPRAAILLIVCGALGFWLDREEERGTFDRVNSATLRWLQANSGPPRKDASVILAEIKDPDLSEGAKTFDTWPLGCLDYALIAEGLARHRPAGLAIEPVMAWPAAGPLELASLAERLTLIPRTTLAATLQKDGAAPDGDSDLAGFARLTRVEGDASALPSFGGVLTTPTPDTRGSRPLGFSSIDLGESEAVHGATIFLPLLARRGTTIVPSLLLQSLISWKSAPPEKVVVRLGQEITVDDLHIPIDHRGRLAVYTGVLAVVPRLEAGSLLLEATPDVQKLAGRAAPDAILKKLSTSLVVLGETHSAARHLALGSGRSLTSPEVLAQAIARIQTGWHVHELPRPWQFALWALAALTGLALLHSTRSRILFVWFLGLLALVITALLTFQTNLTWLPLAQPMALLSAACLVALLLTRPAAAPATPAAA